jgi:hypothetical protein
MADVALAPGQDARCEDVLTMHSLCEVSFARSDRLAWFLRLSHLAVYSGNGREVIKLVTATKRLIVPVQAKNAEGLSAEIERAEAENPSYRVFWITESKDGGFTAFLRDQHR